MTIYIIEQVFFNLKEKCSSKKGVQSHNNSVRHILLNSLKNSYFCDIIKIALKCSQFDDKGRYFIMSVSPDYFEKYHDIISKYMKRVGDGDKKASQVVTAVNRLLYGWYNNGDVFDNQTPYEWSEEWSNDISSYANWLDLHTDLSPILASIDECTTEDDYEELLKTLADTTLNEEYLTPYTTQSKEGDIYKCKGGFKQVIHRHDEEDEEDEEEDW
jgi:hypothetical protein